MSDAELDPAAAAADAREQPADADARDQIDALFQVDEDDDVPSDGGEAKGKRQPRARRGQAGSEEDEEEIATARSLKAKNKSELKQRLQRLAQGKKAESEKKTKRKIKDAVEDDAPAKKGVAKKLRRSKAAAAVPEGAAPADAPDAEAAAHVDSEDDGDGMRTAADDEFIDDDGAEPADSDDDAQDGLAAAPQAEEARQDGGSDDEIEALFKPKSSRRRQRTEAELKELRGEAADLVAQMDVAAEQDAAARAAGQLAVAKLRLLPEVESQLCRVELQQPCLEHNLLGALATWLRPGEDGSLPNLRLRTTLLTICSRLPVDTQEQDGREQLKRSGLGKVIMFYKLHDEVAANRILAARMVEAWSRPIFALSAVYKDLEHEAAELPPQPERAAASRSRAAATAQEAEMMEGNKDARLQPGDPGYRHHAAIPEPARLDYVRRPESKVSSKAAAKGRSDKELTGGAKIMKELKNKRVVKQQFSAHKVSVEGRNLVMRD